MISAQQALYIVLSRSERLGVERLPIEKALGRMLAEKIRSDMDTPPFDRSAMDGFAMNSNDRSAAYKVVDDIPAGKMPKRQIGQGECARIMTGAPLPPGADKVVKVEDTQLISRHLIRIKHFDNKPNVSWRGEDVRKGEIVLKAGIKIRAQEVAILATFGKRKVKVFRYPRVGVISTGSELVEPGKKPGPGKIRNSNSFMLLAQLKRLGIDGIYLGIVRDNFRETVKNINKAIKVSDILLLTGGVSVGDYDFVKEAIKKAGIKLHFNKIAVQPGKPTSFGTKGRKMVFGLPGNPVSSLFIFDLLVRPAIDRMVGRKAKQHLGKSILAADFERRHTDREQYVPVIQSDSRVRPIKFHGSAHMQALTKANGLMRIKRGIKRLLKGATVDVRPI
ncbi:molybdopterin molybdotransferase MoeA [Candidatus Saganbacteria bacterium]|nr:molybdopterin molybdotransferase MoeA [Candidatus Saganbacteria bacterium]